MDALQVRETQFDRVYGEIRRGLMAGLFEPGQKITVASLSSALGVSAMPVREALRRLAAERALEMRPKRSVRVPRLTRAEVVRLRELRELVEGHATTLAAQNITQREVGELSQIQVAMAAARDRQDGKAILRLNEEFHFSIYNRCGMQILIDLIAMLWLHSAPTMTIMFRPPHLSHYPTELQNRTNIALIKALRRGDGAAAADALRNEIRVGTRVLDEAMQSIDWDSQVEADRAPLPDMIDVGRLTGKSVA